MESQLGGAEPVWCGVGLEHSCHICGNALRRVWTAPDEHYGLPVGVCPGCGTACVRRRHPLSVMARSMRRWRIALWGMAWRAGLCGIAIGGSYLVASTLAESLGGLRVRDVAMHLIGLDPIPDQIRAWRDDRGTMYMIVALGWFVALGAGATAGLGHLRRWLVWGLLIAGLAVAPVGYAGVRAMLVMLETVGNWNRPGTFMTEWRQTWPTVEFVGAGLVFAPLGIPVGRMMRRSMDRRGRLVWIARLRRARKQRRDA